MKDPVITIGIVCFNHGHLVEKAINSVLSQDTTFSYELLIADDASTDNSTEVIQAYHKKYPEIIRLFLNEKNIGPVACASKLIRDSKGKYITWLDADDHWTFHSKLQLQVEFLENNPEYTGCFHDALILSTVEENGNKMATDQALVKYRYYSQFNHYTPDFDPLQLIRRNIIPTASLVFRKRDFSDFFGTYDLPLQSFSWAFQLYIIREGKFRYFNQCWSVYLDHAGGLSKKLSSESFSLNNIRILKLFKKDDCYRRYRNRILLSIANEYDCIVYRDGKIKAKYAFKSQCNYFRAWWWTAWYYFTDCLKK